MLNRGFEISLGVEHSDDGLQGTIPGAGTIGLACIEAYLRGARVVQVPGRLTFKNAGWSDSPVKEFSSAVRVYSFLGEQNFCVALGLESGFSIETMNGWHLGPILDEMPGVKVYALVR